MPLDRKTFLRYASALAAAGILPETGSRSGRRAFASPSGETPDEVYWATIRQLFPLTHEWVYLNNGTLGPSPYPVIEAIQTGMMETDRNGGYSGYEDAIAPLAKFVGADADEIALTHNVTEGINIACWGVPLKKGDEVILTTHEHVGNALPWLTRQKADGIVLKAYTPAPTASETLNRISDLITKRTRVIATPHIPCTQGQVLPVREICTLAREKGIFSLIDGAHGPGMIPLDLHEIGCDTYASCCHKWMLGPKGTGFIYVRKGMLDVLQPRFVGGGSDTGKWNMATSPITTTEFAPTAHRFFGGTQSLGLWRGVQASVQFLETIGMHNIHQRIQSLGTYAWQGLAAIPGVEILTPEEQESRCAVVGFRIKKIPHDKFYAQCMEKKVRIRSVAENGLNSLRLSTHIYNNKAEVDRLLELVRGAA